MAKFECPHCSQKIDAPEDLAGTATNCPACGDAITVPALSQKAEPPPLPPQPRVYVSSDGKTCGPYDTATLQRHIDDHEFLPTDLANIVGSDNWQPLSTIASFPAETQEVVEHKVEEEKRSCIKIGCITWLVLLPIIGLVAWFTAWITDPYTSQENPVKASVKASVSASQFVVQVTNNDDFTWQSTQLIVNGPLGYTYDHPSWVRAGDTITVKFNQFSKGDERLNPFTTKVNKVGVWVKGYDIPTFNVK